MKSRRSTLAAGEDASTKLKSASFSKTILSNASVSEPFKQKCFNFLILSFNLKNF
jgi:hypothetical protein